MTPNDDQADRRLLEDFLLGRLADADAERVAARLAEDPGWQALARNLRVTDPLIDAARGAAGDAPPADPPALHFLIHRLEHLSLSSPETRTDNGEVATSDTPGPLLAPDGLWFLRPAQGTDELGRLAGFRILEVLGKGGMGMVFRAEDEQLRRQVALKVIKPECAADPQYRERFLREARAAGQLHHDHVMPVHQVGEDNGVLFLAMPLLAGETLEARLSRDPPLTIAEQVRIGREMALGLAAAHAHGLIHRDVKPSNVWLETQVPAERGGEGEGFRVKILDFGLALPSEGAEPLTEAGMLIGTPAYMSPEQAEGLPLDGRSDLFSLGCVLYRMATGKQPFKRDTLTATLRAVVDHHPAAPREVAPGVPPPLSDLILRLLAKSPADRLASAGATADALRATELGKEAAPAPRPTHPARVRRRTTAAVIGAAVLAGVIALAVVGVWKLLPRGPGPSPSTETPGTIPDKTAYEGYVDVMVWTTAAGPARRMRLTDDDALPLHPGDHFRVEAKVAPQAYLYLFLIDTEGAVAPAYPWKLDKWGTRPAQESPRDELSLPPSKTQGYKLTGDKEGMVTVLLLARPSPLDADDAAVRGWFAGVLPQRPVQNARSAVWFENGRVVKNDERFKPRGFEETEVDDPVLRLQELLRERLQPQAPFTAAVSFARQGK
jgi:hypothetical protein